MHDLLWERARVSTQPSLSALLLNLEIKSKVALKTQPTVSAAEAQETHLGKIYGNEQL